MSNIFNLPEATGVSGNDYIYISGVTNGDRKIKAEKLVGGDPILITKTITENGTYNASSDDAEGYSSVTVEVDFPLQKLLSASQPVSAQSPASEFIWNANAPLTVTEIVSGYLSYDSSTKKFTVLKDFWATLVPWINSADSARSTYCYGKMLINDQAVVGYGNNTTAASQSACGIVTWLLKAGDTISVQCTNQSYKNETVSADPGWPQAGIEIYKGIAKTRTEYRNLDVSTADKAYSFIF